MPPFSLYTALLLLCATYCTATTIGITYNPSIPNLPPPEKVASTLQRLHIQAVHLLEPTPSAVRAFAYTNISLLLSVPNDLVPSFAANLSAATLWLYSHVLPYHPRTRISLISVGSDVITAVAASDADSDPTTTLIPAMNNLHLSLRDLDIHSIPVSTSFSFINVMTTSFPPSSAEFQEPVNSLIITPLLQFLDETNSSLLINLFPYTVYRMNSEIPVGYALFQENPFNFRDDTITGVRYRNLFDMMVDAVIAAMAVLGQENIPVIVTETGWPSEMESEATGNYAEMYLNGLLMHLRSGMGTPLKKEGVAEAYIYQLFDEIDLKNSSNTNSTTISRSGLGSQRWGIMHPNMTLKYSIDFSVSERILGNGNCLVQMLLVLLVLVPRVEFLV
ncbi:Glycosyl hydrolase superfamily protein [Forsythia ovata]|uniref:Glycosyl hydrolase superfamily protein n=1 Tax=Forsythia ovata TaxID=205694 RepID=A0ABD1X7Y2_9LAMI